MNHFGTLSTDRLQIHEHTIRHQLFLLPVQTTLELLLWLFSTETRPELSRVSGGAAVTDDAPKDCTTRGFFWSKKNNKNTNTLLLTLCNISRLLMIC